MRIIITKSTQEAIDVVTSMMFERISSHPTSVIGLATGQTMVPVYASLVQESLKQPRNFEKLFFFMLDEYVGIKDYHPSSFKTYVLKHFLTPLGLKESQCAFPPAHLADKENSGKHYEELIKQSGGIDLQLLGIGVNGHIGFNEPGSSADSRTRLVNLTSSTLAANQAQFPHEKMPTQALSMGIGTILEAKELVLLATGKSKADAIKYLLHHHDDESCPATFLKGHAHFTLVLDPEAASKISLNI
jgi:glucosamine-6-phosphate deaminase